MKANNLLSLQHGNERKQELPFPRYAFRKSQFMSELLIHKSSLQLIVGVLRTEKL